MPGGNGFRIEGGPGRVALNSLAAGLPAMRHCLSMWILILSLWCATAGDLRADKEPRLPPGSREASHAQKDPAATIQSCKDIFSRAISLNDSYKRAVSAGGRRALELEVVKYLHTVLPEKLPGCVSHADADLSSLALELARSLADSESEAIRRELQGLRQAGLDSLYQDDSEAPAQPEVRKRIQTSVAAPRIS